MLLCLTFQNTYNQRASVDVTLGNGIPSAVDFIITSPDEKYIVVTSHKWASDFNGYVTSHDVSIHNLTDLDVDQGSLVVAEIRGPTRVTTATRDLGKGLWLLLVTGQDSGKVFAVNTTDEKVEKLPYMIYYAII